MTSTRTRRGSGRSRSAKTTIAIGLLWLVVLYLGVTFVQVWWAAGRDEASGVSPATADAAVVLGAAQYNGVPSPVLAARLDHALDLYERDLVELVIVTGGGQPTDVTTEAKTGYDYLREAGVPDEDLLLEVGGTNTWESLLAVELIMENNDVTSLLLVSDPYHNHRLSGVATELGLDAAVSPRDGSVTFRRLVRETLAVAAGRIIGYRRVANSV